MFELIGCCIKACEDKETRNTIGRGLFSYAATVGTSFLDRLSDKDGFASVVVPFAQAIVGTAILATYNKPNCIKVSASFLIYFGATVALAATSAPTLAVATLGTAAGYGTWWCLSNHNATNSNSSDYRRMDDNGVDVEAPGAEITNAPAPG